MGADSRRRSARRGRWRRFVVEDRSMEPTLVAGQGLVARSGGPARPGQLRVFEHPRRPGFWLVKRVESVDGRGGMRVLSDDRSVESVDSRELGTVPVDGSYRVVLAVPLRLMGRRSRRAP